MNAGRLGVWLAGLCLPLLLAHRVSAVDIEISVTLDGGAGTCLVVTSACTETLDEANLPSTIRVAFDVSAASTLNGYQLNVSWDASELSLMSAEQLLPDTGIAGSFTLAPDANQGDSFPDGIGGMGTRVSKLLVSPVGSTALLALNFQIVGDLGTDSDVDLTWRPQGDGLAPGSVVLDNSGGADLVFSQVPEPRTALLYLSALLAVAALRRLR